MADKTVKQETKINTETEFKEWLKDRDKKVGEGILSHRTQGSYLTAMRSSLKFFAKEYGRHKNIFEITDPIEYAGIINAIESNEEAFMNYNTHRNFSSGAETYLAFLNGEGKEVGKYILPEARYGGERYEGELAHARRPAAKSKHSGGGKTSGGGETNKESSRYENHRNLIFFGAPGTGKSYELNRQKNILLNEDDSRCIRVTFHPDYSYAHFVGTYKPVPDDKNSNEITYKYVPGPFMQTYVAARENPDKAYALVIEEINRANVAAVFGDVFQLLDRTKDGESEYPIKASEDIQNYLKNRNWSSKDYEWIRIPKNMYIWATMNSADQGVFPMDTAFKRRWDFVYLGINTGDDKIVGKMVPMGGSGDKEWNEVRRKINDQLAALGINEDKQLGAFFINAEIIANALKDEKGKEAFKSTFKNKVLMYLFEDAAKHKRSEMFNVKSMRYSEICKTFDNSGLAVFKGFNDKPAGSGEQTEKTTEQSDIDKPENTDGEQHS